MIETLTESGNKLIEVLSFKREDDYDEETGIYGEYVQGEVLLEDNDTGAKEVWYIRTTPSAGYCISFSYKWEQFYLEFGYTPA